MPRYKRTRFAESSLGGEVRQFEIRVVVVILLIPGKRSHRQKKKGRSSGTGPERRRVGCHLVAHRSSAHWVDSHSIRARWVAYPYDHGNVTDGDYGWRT